LAGFEVAIIGRISVATEVKDIDETFRKCVLGLELGMAKTKPGTKLNREYAAALKQIKRQYKATMKSLRTSAK
jgi:hypothetical protein